MHGDDDSRVESLILEEDEPIEAALNWLVWEVIPSNARPLPRSEMYSCLLGTQLLFLYLFASFSVEHFFSLLENEVSL